MCVKKPICGIYFIEIVGGNPNKIGQKYVGQTINFQLRKYHHTEALRSNKRDNPKLQNYYNKYGKDSLKISFLMECDKKDLNFWEEFFIKCFDSHKHGLNCNGGGQNCSTDKCKKSCTLKNRHTDEVFTEESRAEFERKHGISKQSIQKLLNGRMIYYNEWVLPNGNYVIKTHSVIDPTGKSYIIEDKDVAAFCKQHNIPRRRFRDMLKKRTEFMDGWGRTNSIKKERKTTAISFTLVNPNGEIIKGKNLSKFCRENNLSCQNLGQIIKGRHFSHKGWTQYKGEIA